MSRLQSFIVEHLYEKDVDVYCGGVDKFSGKVKAIADDVLTLENDGVYTFVAVDKIIALWLKK